MLDMQTEFGARVAQRLRQESTIWLTTVGVDGTPQPRPVWFLWDPENSSFLIFSMPSAAKVRHIRHNPRVALNLNTDDGGDDVAVFIGEARVIGKKDISPAERQAYLDKYQEGIKNIGMSEASFEQDYSVPIRVTAHKMRGF